MSDRASEIIEHGDPADILKMAVGAFLAADEGRFCRCEEPSLHGDDLLCGNCLLENEGQREHREAHMRGPHRFVTHFPRGKDLTEKDREFWEGMGMCDVCSGWRRDPRHTGGEREP